jgi:hypothetical protein
MASEVRKHPAGPHFPNQRLETSMSKVVQESSVRIMAADSCFEIEEFLLDEEGDGVTLNEGIDACVERWPRRWHAATIAATRALIGHIIVEETVYYLDRIERGVQGLIVEMERDHAMLADQVEAKLRRAAGGSR